MESFSGTRVLWFVGVLWRLGLFSVLLDVHQSLCCTQEAEGASDTLIPDKYLGKVLVSGTSSWFMEFMPLCLVCEQEGESGKWEALFRLNLFHCYGPFEFLTFSQPCTLSIEVWSLASFRNPVNNNKPVLILYFPNWSGATIHFFRIQATRCRNL